MSAGALSGRTVAFPKQRNLVSVDVPADAVRAGRMPPPPRAVPDDVNGDLPHDDGPHQVHLESALRSPSCAERVRVTLTDETTGEALVSWPGPQ
ncbi:hypothetical protein ACE1SV_00110 [Streptomyces sp. E-15]